jgi:branched-chain amino acid transport system permease protein
VAALTAFVQNLIGGLLIGGVYALIGSGLSLIFGVMRVINFSHGEFVAVGMYFALALNQWIGLDPYLSLLLALPAGYLLGLVAERLVLNRLVDAPEGSTLLATLGLGLVLSNALQLVFGAEPRSVYTPYATATLALGGVTLSVPLLLAGVVALAIIGLLSWFLARTELGRAVRATAQNRLGAELAGIDTRRIHGFVFGVGAMLVVAVGVILLPLLFVTPTIGATYTLKAFVVTVLGGLGNTTGAIAGGLVLGVVEVLGASYLSTAYRDAYGLVAFLALLLFRPQGLLGRGARRV